MSKIFFRLLIYIFILFSLILPQKGFAEKYPFPKDWVGYISEITKAKYPKKDDSVEDENLKNLIRLIEKKFDKQISGDKDIRVIVKNRKKAFDLILKSMERYPNNRYREAVVFLAYQLGAMLPDLIDYTRLFRIKTKLIEDATEIIKRDYYKDGITLFSLITPIELCEYMGTTPDRGIWYGEEAWRSKNHLRLNSQEYFNEVLNLQRQEGETVATEEAIRITKLRNDLNNLIGAYYFAWKFSHGTQQLNYARDVMKIVTQAGKEYPFNNYAEGYIKTVNSWLSRKLKATIRTVEINAVSSGAINDWGKFRLNLANNPVINESLTPHLQVAWKKNLNS